MYSIDKKLIVSILVISIAVSSIVTGYVYLNKDVLIDPTVTPTPMPTLTPSASIPSGEVTPTSQPTLAPTPTPIAEVKANFVEVSKTDTNNVTRVVLSVTLTSMVPNLSYSNFRVTIHEPRGGLIGGTVQVASTVPIETGSITSQPFTITFEYKAVASRTYQLYFDY